MSSPPAPQAVSIARELKAYEFLFKPFQAADAVSIMQTYARITAPTKILIVDDSQTVRQIIQKTIKASLFKCWISEAADGRTAEPAAATRALGPCRGRDDEAITGLSKILEDETKSKSCRGPQARRILWNVGPAGQ